MEIEAAGPVSSALISRIVAQVRGQSAGAIERRISRFAAITRRPWSFSRSGHDRSALSMWAVSGIRPELAALARLVYRGLVVLVIACPCAADARRRWHVVTAWPSPRGGVLIKGAIPEEIGRLRALAFDKTGTLTLGQPDVVEIVCAPGRDDQTRSCGSRRLWEIGAGMFWARRSLATPATQNRCAGGR